MDMDLNLNKRLQIPAAAAGKPLCCLQNAYIEGCPLNEAHRSVVAAAGCVLFGVCVYISLSVVCV